MAASDFLPHLKTPPTYHRIISPTLQIPTDPTTSIPVGLLACQRAPLLSPTYPNLSIAHLAKPKPKPPTESFLEVLLHDTILFPESGSQPSDIGLITTPDGETWEVVQVKGIGGHAVHFVKPNPGLRNIKTALNSFRAGGTVLVTFGEEGFKRRFDHMCMNTSQHLLSDILETQLSLPTLYQYLETFPEPSSIEIPRPLTPSEITFIQDLANRLVLEGRSVHVEVEESRSGNGPGVQIIKVGEGSVGMNVTEDNTGGVKRVVVIDGVGRRPCYGTHLLTLHNLQLFILPTSVTVSRGPSAMSTRIFFLSGPRLLTCLTTSHPLLTSTASILSCGLPLLLERAGQVVEEHRKVQKRKRELEHEFVALIAGSLVSEISMRREGEEGLVVMRRHRIDDNAPHPSHFLQPISHSFISSVFHLKPPPKYLVVLSSTTAILVFGSDEGAVKSAREGLWERLGAKGEWQGIRWSGGFGGVWAEEREGMVVEEVIEEVRRTWKIEESQEIDDDCTGLYV
ncbi:hypothetical protein JAAARDRAFT_117058 [Jaapia argillacea MUCL 33604]|uniref:Uncharacterized protein n=1 Tax=Jaapia argillacea MUCL 33604 TaxID=933084 RepID=A0A067QBA7_9AGAM|nr:hypothetical protein JAAARDRAFT_117058 [Jaapia argillacea MUCL 33604]